MKTQELLLFCVYQAGSFPVVLGEQCPVDRAKVPDLGHVLLYNLVQIDWPHCRFLVVVGNLPATRHGGITSSSTRVSFSSGRHGRRRSNADLPISY